MTAEVSKITDLPDEEDVDLDLDAEDALLREAIGAPTSVKLKGGRVVWIPHPTDWPSAANAAASRADFDAWAAEVLNEDDYRAWQAANLRNYQINAVFEKVNRRAGVTPGKSRPSPRSSRSKARR